jgi:hypothetical protein
MLSKRITDLTDGKTVADQVEEKNSEEIAAEKAKALSEANDRLGSLLGGKSEK